jgi:hypothetical protein
MGRGISRVVMIVRVVILCGLLLVLAAMAWQYVGARHGNKLVDEGNAAIAAATKLAIEAAGHYETLITDATIKDLAANRNALRPAVEQTASLYAEATTQFRAGGEKFEEASRQHVAGPVRDYWKVKAEQVQTLGAANDTRRRIVLLLMDGAVTDLRSFHTKGDSLLAEVKKQTALSVQLEAKADKIMAANKETFK